MNEISNPPSPTPALHFVEALEDLRLSRNLSKRQLANIIDISPQMYSSYLHGDLPSLKVLKKIREEFNVTLDWLLFKWGEMSPDLIQEHALALWDRLEAARVHRGLDSATFAAELGLPEWSPEAYRQTKLQPSAAMILRAITSFDLNPHWLQSGMGKVFANYWLHLANRRALREDGSIDLQATSFDIPRPPGFAQKLFAWEVDSSDATPRYEKGDVLYLAAADQKPRSGDEVLVIVKLKEGIDVWIRQWNPADENLVQLTSFQKNGRSPLLKRSLIKGTYVVVGCLRAEQAAEIKRRTEDARVSEDCDATR